MTAISAGNHAGATNQAVRADPKNAREDVVDVAVCRGDHANNRENEERADNPLPHAQAAAGIG